jgi:hypothetical protein
MGTNQSSYLAGPNITHDRPMAQSSADYKDQFDYRINTSHVNPATGSVLPTVNPLALIPRQVRSGQIQQVLFQQSWDPRGDIDHRVGARYADENANPRAQGSLDDRQRLARVYNNDRNVPIPIVG